MSISSSKQEQREKHCGCKPDDCIETSYPTQKKINAARLIYCDEINLAAGNVKRWEQTYDGENNLYNQRKRMFSWTEYNFQIHRNTEISIGTTLIQSTDLIKDNVKNYIEWGSKLAGVLKDISKKVNEAKAKMGELMDASCKLNNAKTTNAAEWSILTGKPLPKCNEDQQYGGTSSKDYPEKCKDIENTINDLICMPKSLGNDVNSISSSSYDIRGIHIFSNISTLDPIQKSLAEKSKSFDTHLQDVTKAREGDMKKLQESLVKSAQETTKAAAGLYTSRSTFEGLLDTTKYLCCPKCGCIPKEAKNCEPHLAECECCICKICEDVKYTFCNNEDCDKTKTEVD